ncbi:hypothetical protein BP6252_00279 [Coleophoma cylindrospora]|uniref:Uncharacterized protein n=1 Tax=Coleophoma cylindrospora TaxID=1849047 RepID=A0A3D8SPM2_9HELO|nr:hypothetical protein BP6252_00279 [Coleophoma cylindrospora]
MGGLNPAAPTFNPRRLQQDILVPHSQYNFPPPPTFSSTQHSVGVVFTDMWSSNYRDSPMDLTRFHESPYYIPEKFALTQHHRYSNSQEDDVPREFKPMLNRGDIILEGNGITRNIAFGTRQDFFAASSSKPKMFGQDTHDFLLHLQRMTSQERRRLYRSSEVEFVIDVDAMDDEGYSMARIEEDLANLMMGSSPNKIVSQGRSGLSAKKAEVTKEKMPPAPSDMKAFPMLPSRNRKGITFRASKEPSQFASSEKPNSTIGDGRVMQTQTPEEGKASSRNGNGKCKEIQPPFSYEHVPKGPRNEFADPRDYLHPNGSILTTIDFLDLGDEMEFKNSLNSITVRLVFTGDYRILSRTTPTYKFIESLVAVLNGCVNTRQFDVVLAVPRCQPLTKETVNQAHATLALPFYDLWFPDWRIMYQQPWMSQPEELHGALCKFMDDERYKSLCMRQRASHAEKSRRRARASR